MIRIRFLSIVLLMGFFVFVGVPVAQAQEKTSISAASREYAFLIGYGTSHPGFGETRKRGPPVALLGRALMGRLPRVLPPRRRGNPVLHSHRSGCPGLTPLPQHLPLPPVPAE